VALVTLSLSLIAVVAIVLRQGSKTENVTLAAVASSGFSVRQQRSGGKIIFQIL
jgi:hypothetical protein